MKLLKRCALGIAAVVLSGCAWHAVPSSQTPHAITQAPRYNLFVDQSGTFYPAQWEQTYGRPPRTGAYALATLAEQNGTLAALRDEETRTLDTLQARLAGATRVFILVHGFNNDEADANEAYEAIERSIAMQEGDAVVAFYWDGLKARGPGGAGKIWFNAAGYSQLAGSKGLRRVLNRIRGKDVVIISHSRGASVVLSALSDPPYDPDFARETREWHNLGVYDHEQLAENGNSINVVMLAPAIGAVDFRARDYPSDTTFRQFTPQLRRLVHTVNPNDPILRKPLPGVADKFNPTDFGQNVVTAVNVGRQYPAMARREISLRAHGFREYVAHPSFTQMLRELGVQTRS